MMKNNTSEGQFACLYDLFFNPVLHHVHDRVTELAKKYDCKKIIDLGSGTGQQARVLSAQGFSVTGVDASSKMIVVAQKKSTSDISFIQDTIQSVDFDDDFDAANISMVLHPNSERSINQIIEKTVQLVKSDGLIFITDYGRGTGYAGRVANGLIQIIESLTDQNHRKNYFSFMKNRGLNLISTYPYLKIIEQCSYFHGALQTNVYRVSKE